MKPIAAEDRRVANIREAAYTPWESEENPGTDYLSPQLGKPSGHRVPCLPHGPRHPLRCP